MYFSTLLCAVYESCVVCCLKYTLTKLCCSGMNESGEVANEVETEQIVHDASYTNHRYVGKT